MGTGSAPFRGLSALLASSTAQARASQQSMPSPSAWPRRWAFRSRRSVDRARPDAGMDGFEVVHARARECAGWIVTCDRGPEEWLATFPDPIRAQGALDCFTSGAFGLIIEGESYRDRQKPLFNRPRPRATQQSLLSARLRGYSYEGPVEAAGPVDAQTDARPPGPWTPANGRRHPQATTGPIRGDLHRRRKQGRTIVINAAADALTG